jgi:hypothetical protein
MSPTSSTTTLFCAAPGELVAAIPALVRFAPTDSLVLITYTGVQSLTLQSAVRMDLPRPQDIPAVAQQLRVVLTNHRASVVELVVLGGGDPDRTEPPHRALVENLQDTFDHAGIVTSHATWAPSTERARNGSATRTPSAPDTWRTRPPCRSSMRSSWIPGAPSPAGPSWRPR